MRKIKLLSAIFFVMVIFSGSISASSFDINLTPEKIKAKQGDVVEIEVSLKDIDMTEKGMNTLEGYIEYDKDVINSVEIESKNNWKTIYNSDNKSELYGKFLTLKDTESVKENENIAVLRFKIKDKIRKQSTKIIIKEIMSNDGEELVNIGNREIEIEFEGINVVNTGDITVILLVGVILIVLLVNIMIRRKHIKE